MNYYNETNPKKAAWLRELMRRDLIAPGEVDERSIEDVAPVDLAGFTQCHFFAGIGGWSYALRLAGVSDETPVWTGSCPCQPFSPAGKGEGFADERHLWPAWFHLIEQCEPDIVFGEQSSAAVEWLDLVCADLEAVGYTTGTLDLPAASVGAPHIRQRLWFVAHSECGAAERHGYQLAGAPQGVQGAPPERQRLRDQSGDGRAVGVVLDDANCAGLEGLTGDVHGSDEPGREQAKPDGPTAEASAPCDVGDTDGGSESVRGGAQRKGRHTGAEGIQRRGEHGLLTEDSGTFWSDCDWIYCTDGVYRPVKPGTSPLAHGVPERVLRISGYGDAIVPQVAAEFIRAFAQQLELRLEESRG